MCSPIIANGNDVEIRRKCLSAWGFGVQRTEWESLVSRQDIQKYVEQATAGATTKDPYDVGLLTLLSWTCSFSQFVVSQLASHFVMLQGMTPEEINEYVERNSVTCR
jgi:hypothetical protein